MQEVNEVDASYYEGGQKPSTRSVTKRGRRIISTFGNNKFKGECNNCSLLCYNKVCPNCKLIGWCTECRMRDLQNHKTLCEAAKEYKKYCKEGCEELKRKGHMKINVVRVMAETEYDETENYFLNLYAGYYSEFGFGSSFKTDYFSENRILEKNLGFAPNIPAAIYYYDRYIDHEMTLNYGNDIENVIAVLKRLINIFLNGIGGVDKNILIANDYKNYLRSFCSMHLNFIRSNNQFNNSNVEAISLLCNTLSELAELESGERQDLDLQNTIDSYYL